MNKIFKYSLLFIAVIACHVGAAQKNEPYELMVDGVKVIVKPGGNDIVVVHTIIKGGVQNYPLAKAGIENLAITSLTECGTLKDDKNSYKDKLDKVSAIVAGNTDMDYASFRLNCIKSDFATVWPLYTEAMLIPKFDAKEFNRVKQDLINEIRTNESNPDVAINKMARQTAFSGKNYAKEPDGTVETVSKLTLDETKQYWKSIFTRSRLVIVIVGDLGRDDLEGKIHEFLKKVPTGTPFVQKKESLSPVSNSFKSQKKDNATNYIQGITPGPVPGTAEFNAFVLASRIFSQRHFVEIRTKNGLSYAPGIWFSSGTSNYANIFVTTTEPDKYIAISRQLMDKVKKEGFTREELKDIKTEILTGEYYRQETNDALANAIAKNEVVHGNWKRAFTIKDDIKKVTLEQANNSFRKYMNNISWTYQGDTKKVNPVLFTQKQTPAVPVEKKGF